MTVNSKHKHQPENRWNQSGFEKLKASWSPERIAEDKKLLERIFAMAAECPVLAEALDWAHQHEMQFFVDRQAVNVGGYYNLGTGVLALVPSSLMSDARAVEVLVHEIRHAWQDYNGLLTWDDETPHQGNFNDFFINNALIEADATAFGSLAAAQLSMTRLEKRKANQPLKKWEQELLSGQQAANEKVVLGKGFLGWFTGKWRPQFYGDYASKFYGKKWGLYDGSLPPRNLEFDVEPPSREGMNVHDIRDVLRLGVNFSGTKNYLAALPPDILPRKILSPSLANNFWRAANARQEKLTTELRKACLKKKLAPENRKPRHLWP
jgi:hypothetical protein